MTRMIDYYQNFLPLSSQFYEYYVFGNGKFSWIPIFWLSWGTLYTILYMYYQGNYVIFVAIFVGLLDLGINLLFGYHYLQSNQLQKFLLYYKDKYAVPYEQSMHKMHLASFICLFILIAVSIIFCIQSAFIVSGDLISILLILITYVPFTVVVVGSSIHLCIIWCYQMYIIQEAVLIYVCTHLQLNSTLTEKNTASGESMETIPTNNPLVGPSSNTLYTTPSPSHYPPLPPYQKHHVERMLFPFLLEMRTLSDEWKWNHMMRCITGVIIGFTEMISAFSDPEHVPYFIADGIIAIVYFGIIWITAMSAGYVNDKFFKLTFRQLANIYQSSEDEEARECIIDRHHSSDSINDRRDERVKNFDQEVIATITKLNAVRHVDGLHFAGASMSMEKAFSIGSILISLIVFGIRFFARL